MMLGVFLGIAFSTTFSVNDKRVEASSVLDAIGKAGLRPLDVTLIEVAGAVEPGDLIKLAETCKELKKLTMAGGSLIAGGVLPEKCFSGSKLVEVALHGVQTIGKAAFEKCVELKSITAPTVTVAGDDAFNRCYSLVSVSIDKMTKLGLRSFQDCRSLEKFTVPLGVAELPKTVFHGCNKMTQLTIAGPVTVIPEDFFFGIPLLGDVNIPASLRFTDSTGFMSTVPVRLIRVEGFHPSDEEYVVPALANEIGDETLRGCKGVKSIVVHDKIRKIGKQAFADMDDLAKVTFAEPSSLIRIEDEAMARCQKLTTITIPRSVITVGECVFGHSWALRDVYVYQDFDSEWYAEGILSETHAKILVIRDGEPEIPARKPGQPVVKPCPLRKPQRPPSGEEKRMHKTNKKPNFVFFFSDQQRWDTIGPNGQKLDITPFIDQLAREGVNFPNCFCSQPLCGPVRSIIQTGVYPTENGCFKNAVPLPVDQKDRFADQLKAAGYNIAYIGKWHLASDKDQQHYETIAVPMQYRGGWDQYWVASDVLEFTSTGYGGYIWDTENNKREFTGYRVDCVTDYALEYIRNYEDTDKPFFLFLSHLEPHHQNDHHAFEGPEGSKEMFKDFERPLDLLPGKGDWEKWMPDYLGSCWSLDKNFGRVVNALKEKGIYDDTVVIYTTDHGCHFGTRLYDVEPGGGDDYKSNAFEASLHIPFVIKAPGFEGGVNNPAFITTIDWPPTLMKLAQGEIPASWKGRLIQDSNSPDWENIIFVQVSGGFVGRAIRCENWTYVIHAAGKNPYQHPGSDKDEWTDKHLFDLINDPAELHDLKDDPDYYDIKMELRKILIRKIQDAGEGTFVIVDKPSQPLTGDL